MFLNIKPNHHSKAPKSALIMPVVEVQLNDFEKYNIFGQAQSKKIRIAERKDVILTAVFKSNGKSSAIVNISGKDKILHEGESIDTKTVIKEIGSMHILTLRNGQLEKYELFNR